MGYLKLTAIAAAAFSLANICAYPMSGTGKSSSASKLDFAISIPRSAELRITCLPGAIEITAADVASGYVDVPLAWCVEIRANTPYEISFMGRASWFRSASLRGLPVVVEIRYGTGLFEESRPAGSVLRMPLGVTFHLDPGTSPGHYAWPLSMVLAGK